MTVQLNNRYADLGAPFSVPAKPTQVTQPKMLLWNQELATQLGLEMSIDQQASFFSGQTLLPGSKPVAMAYSGHQFGQFNPHLGDGRAHLLGDLESSDGQRFDVHLKGSGRTPFSRNGDGLCALKPAVREFLMSEAMHALGVPTTRTLAVVTTGDTVMRPTTVPGAVVTRIAESHLRIGTFEYFAARQQVKELTTLADLAAQWHAPDAISKNKTDYLKLLSQIIDKQIQLIVGWMRVGFIHGVMNTDNILLSGHTIDYGPCAMMGVYDPSTVFSSIDHQGRYAFGNQPGIMHWNLARLAECLLPLIDADSGQAIAQVMPLIEGYAERFHTAYQTMMARKLGFQQASQAVAVLINDLLDLMQTHQLDYTETFYQLGQSLTDPDLVMNPRLTEWTTSWLRQLQEHNTTPPAGQHLMQHNNPVVIPRNHHVEAVLADTEQSLQADGVERYLAVLRKPYEVQATTVAFMKPDADADLNYQTFCGT